MANIKEVAEELCRLTAKEVNELSQVMKSEYGIEPAACIEREIERRRIKEYTSPKQYGMALMQRRQQKQARRRNK